MQTPYPGIGRCIKVLSDTPHKWVTLTGRLPGQALIAFRHEVTPCVG